MGNIRNKKRKIKVENYDKNSTDSKFLSRLYVQNIKFTVISVFVVLLVMISSSYAIFSSVQKSNKYNTLKLGTLKVSFTDNEQGMGNIINLNGEYPESDEEGQLEEPYTFKITNTGTLDASYSIKILDDTDMINEDNCSNNLLDKAKLRVSVNGDIPFTLSDKAADGYIIETGILEPDANATYSLRIWISENSDNSVLGKHYHGKIVVESINKKSTKNENIKAVYTYNQEGTGSGTAYTGCLGGTEAGCVEMENVKKNTTYPVGTIIKYEVAPGVEKYFNVLYDKGDKLVMQQRENTVYSTAWYVDGGDNTKGPTTILSAIENATSSWTNVNPLTYTTGTTEFGTGDFKTAHTACTWANGAALNASQCGTDTYPSLSKTNVNARIITANEAGEMGCKLYKSGGTSNMSCKKFMNNYLYESTSYGGTVVDDYHTANGHNYGYWTLSSNRSSSGNALHIHRFGYVDTLGTFYLSFGARAVVEIDK